MDNPEITRLLTEIRDAQRKLADEYQRVANESLQLQRQSAEVQRLAVEQQSIAVAAQLKHGRLYRIAVAVSTVVLIGFVIFLYRIAA